MRYEPYPVPFFERYPPMLNHAFHGLTIIGPTKKLLSGPRHAMCSCGWRSEKARSDRKAKQMFADHRRQFIEVR